MSNHCVHGHDKWNWPNTETTYYKFLLEAEQFLTNSQKTIYLKYYISCLYAPAIAYPKIYMSPQLEKICKIIAFISWLFIVIVIFGKRKTWHLAYLAVCMVLACFWVLYEVSQRASACEGLAIILNMSVMLQ